MNPAIIILAKMKKIIRKFYKLDALTAETAKTKEDLKIRSSLIFQKLISKGIIISAGSDKYYLNAKKEEEHFIMVKKRILVLLIIIIFISICFAFNK